jgi:hypothetical protein
MKYTSMIVAVSGLLVGWLALSGCASTAHKLNEVSVGMTKSEVLAKLGSPNSTRANEGVEYLVYKLRDRVELDPIKAQSIGEDYFVQLKDGRVVSYGKVGDFGTAR